MAEKLLVKTDLLERCAGELKSAANGFGDAASILASLNTSQDWWQKIGGFSALRLQDEGSSTSMGTARDAVYSMTSVLRRYDNRTVRLGNSVSRAADLFRETENQLSGMNGNQGSSREIGAIAASGAIASWINSSGGGGGHKFMNSAVDLKEASASIKDSEAYKTLLKIIGKFGYVGGPLSFFAKWIPEAFGGSVTGADTVSSYLKDVSSTLKGLYDWVKSDKGLQKLARMDPSKAKEVGWKRAFGLNNLKTFHSQAGWRVNGIPVSASWWQHAKSLQGWKTRFYNNFHNYIDGGPFKNFTEGGATSVFAWAGALLSLAGNGFTNYGRYKDGEISGKRAVAQTITETTVDIVKGWAIGAGVAAAVGATIGSTPVLLVGALTVGVTVGLDAVTKWATKKFLGEEKSLTRLVSDVVLDVGEGAIKVGKKVLDSAWKKAKKYLPKVSFGW